MHLALPCANGHVRADRIRSLVGDALDAGDVGRIYKQMAHRAGLSADAIARISGHSTRVGAAQDMLRYGEQLPGPSLRCIGTAIINTLIRQTFLPKKTAS
jgi:hypothetical protein